MQSFVAILFTDAVEVTDEDINSPLVSYLLAKVQRLESQIMVRPNIRNTRKTTEKPTKPPVVAAKSKQCNCPPSVVTLDGVTLLVPIEQIPSTLE